MHELLAPRDGSANGQATIHPTHDIFNGMVSEQKRAVASSEGGLLIDDLTDWIDEQVKDDADRREVRRTHPRPERIAAQVSLGWFLPHPVAPAIDFDTDRLLRAEESLGWDLVCARARHSSGKSPKRRRGRPIDDPAYRFAVVQSELYRRYLRLAVQRLDVRPLAHYLKHLALWQLERDHGEHVERVVHTLLDRSARGLGLETAA
jgi:hypothetical protein